MSLSIPRHTSHGTQANRSCDCFEALNRPDRFVIVLFGKFGTAWTPAQSVAIVCSITKPLSGLVIFTSLLVIGPCFAKLILSAYTSILDALSRPG
jgi:hypothetical protein